MKYGRSEAPHSVRGSDVAMKNKAQTCNQGTPNAQSHYIYVYGAVFGFILVAVIVIGFYSISQEIPMSGSHDNRYSVLNGEGILFMHGTITAIEGTTITFEDDHGETQEITQDNADDFHVGQYFHFNYTLDEEGLMKTIPNSVGGH